MRSRRCAGLLLFVSKYRITLDDIHEWIDENETTVGHEIMTDEDIVAAVTGNGDEEDSDADADKNESDGLKLNVVRESADILLQFVANSSDPVIQNHYDQLRLLRSKIIVKQHQSGGQTKIHQFFKSATTAKTATPAETTTTAEIATSADAAITITTATCRRLRHHHHPV